MYCLGFITLGSSTACLGFLSILLALGLSKILLRLYWLCFDFVIINQLYNQALNNAVLKNNLHLFHILGKALLTRTERVVKVKYSYKQVLGDMAPGEDFNLPEEKADKSYKEDADGLCKRRICHIITASAE